MTHTPLLPPRAVHGRPPRRLATPLVLLTMLAAATAAVATQPVTPTSLATAPRPEPSNLSTFVADKATAIALGKALFWDTRLGSDGKTACASCHFHAGADTRSKNQVSPGPNRTTFAFGGPNYQLKPSDFPFHQVRIPDDRNSTVFRSNANVSSSQGVFKESFNNIVVGQGTDARQVVYDPVFHVGANNTRQVEPRNSPTVINAVFNLRNFWDGRAQTIFNGVNPWGKRDSNAKVYRSPLPWNPLNLISIPYSTSVTINDASLASQASGPPLSDLEMSAKGRPFADLGRKMYSLRPLAGQQVAGDDSVLGTRRRSDGDGLAVANYGDMVRTAFKTDWWNANRNITLNGKSYTQMEANFSLFFGLALQLYQATLVSDQTPFDRHAQGQSGALNPVQLQGFSVFLGKGKCVNCHGGPVFTNAAIRRGLLTTERMSRMVMGDGRNAVYDEGFYNIGVTRTADDLGVGGKDPFGNALSFSAIAKKSSLQFYSFEQQSPNVTPSSTERIAVNGAFKTPTLRNVALTAPYFHDGSASTLMQVVELYNRGGNFARENIADLDADIQPLGLTPAEKHALVAFMEALTDDRVLKHAAPFDHPQLPVPNGHVGDTNSVAGDGAGRAVDEVLMLPAVGRTGYATGSIPKTFLADSLQQAGMPPANAASCAPEGGTCVIPNGATATVWFGAGSKWSARYGVPGSIVCDAATFGDPVYGTVKSCVYQSTASTVPPPGATYCAPENGSCVIPGGRTVTVLYGASGSWREKQGVSGAISCDSVTFGGDPAFPAIKSCFFQ